MDDLLDSWRTVKIKSQIQNQEEESDGNAPALEKKKKKVSSLPSPSCCFNLPLRHDVGHKIKKLNEKLDLIFKEREKYGIDFTRQAEVVERPITTSFVDVSYIIGRDNSRDELMSNLLDMGSQEESNPHVIYLVGMGGIWKSTLAQVIYNHLDVKAHFQQKIWVCVSDPFDQRMVAKAIIESIKGQSPILLNFKVY